MKKKKYIFITGCARSGTTALAKIIRAHPGIVLGMERYYNRFNSKESKLRPKHFSFENFFDKDNSIHDEYHASIKSKYQQAKYIGDKIPPIFKNYDKLYRQFPQAAVLFTYRNIFDVATSYEKRKKDEDDKIWKKGVEAAVRDWNRSLKETLITLEDPKRMLFPINYESLFFGEFKIDKLIKKLDLKSTPKFRQNLSKIKSNATLLEEKRENLLSSSQKNYIMRYARFDLYKKLLILETK